MKTINIGNVKIGGNLPFVLIAGPCVIENLSATLLIADKLIEITNKLNIPLIFKASYDKANRTSVKSYRGPGLKKGLEILNKVKKKFNVPILTDAHCKDDVKRVSEVADVIQIPAFLSRQTDLLIEAAKTKKIVNIKKGQFLAPWDIKNAIEKIKSAGNERIILTERGVSFGYNNLVVDFRSIPIMRETGYPVVFDATHSIQLPGGKGSSSGGEREMVSYLARAAIAVGIDGLFLEVHPEPEKALCDGPNSLKLNDLPEFLRQIKELDDVVKK
ncbi:MAG: 3-deoxy-8-phosphooctulonate synthase [Deltaproteobacteria bacterium]|nr:3-deoxy-8-phosphooctulonate synthase [Deltaproteobacteria bacterium]